MEEEEVISQAPHLSLCAVSLIKLNSLSLGPVHWREVATLMPEKGKK